MSVRVECFNRRHGVEHKCVIVAATWRCSRHLGQLYQRQERCLERRLTLYSELKTYGLAKPINTILKFAYVDTDVLLECSEMHKNASQSIS